MLRHTLTTLLAAACALLAVPALASASSVKTYIYGGGTVEVFKHSSWELQYKCDGGRDTPTGVHGATCEKGGFGFSNVVKISARPYAGYRFAGYHQPGNACVGVTNELCETTSWTSDLSVYAHFVDDEAPETNLINRPDPRTRSRSADFVVNSYQSGATFHCRLDGAAWYACGPDVPLRNLADGTHKLEAFATDPSGNVDPTPAEYSWVVDATGAAVQVTTSPPAYTRGAQQITFVSEPGARFECAISSPAGSGSWNTCQSPARIEPNREGTHILSIRAYDELNNVGAVVSRTWVNDTQAPAISIDAGPNDGVTVPDRSVSFAFTTSDANPHQASCSIDDGEYAVCSSPYRLSNLSDGPHVLRIRADDGANNTRIAVRPFAIDATAPNAQITDGPAEGSSTTDRTARVSFQAGETGATMKCSVNGAPFATCASPMELTDLPIGATSFQVIATDRLGNQQAMATKRAWTITAPPVQEQPKPDPGSDSSSGAGTPGGGQPGGSGTPAIPVAPAAPTADTTAPVLTVTAAKRIRITPRVKTLDVSTRCSEACTVKVSGSVKLGASAIAFTPVSLRLATTGGKLRLTIPAKLRAALRANARGGVATLTAVATDAAGNRTVRTVRITLTR